MVRLVGGPGTRYDRRVGTEDFSRNFDVEIAARIQETPIRSYAQLPLPRGEHLRRHFIVTPPMHPMEATIEEREEGILAQAPGLSVAIPAHVGSKLPRAARNFLLGFRPEDIAFDRNRGGNGIVCSATIRMVRRIASPETLPDADPVASLKCSLMGAVREASDEDGQHGAAIRSSGGRRFCSVPHTRSIRPRPSGE